MSKGLVIIPTYNEAENIAAVTSRVLDIARNLDILIIDDNSQDGTRDIIRSVMKRESRVRLIERPSKLGLGTAYVLGFKYALTHGYAFAFEMDADLSHDPDELPRFIEEVKFYDLVIGSRYVNGVSVVNWPMKRLLLSFFACLFARKVTGVPIRDLTSGFKCYSRRALQAVNWDDVKTNGYGFQIEADFRIYKAGLRVKEIPIIFVERRAGTSKMSKRIIWQAFWLVWKLRLAAMFKNEFRRNHRKL
jgi:dolichol-phosphate mannosyltransferase